MKNITALLVLLFAATIITAWNVQSTNTPKDYTYQTDKRFSNVQQFIGQRLLPHAYSQGNFKAKKEALNVGDIELFITAKTLMVKGLNPLETFNIIGRKPLSKGLGYEFLLSFDRGRGASKMKVNLDSLGQIQQLKLESPHHLDYTFYLPQKTASQLHKENDFFTEKTMHKIKHYRELVGKTVYPNRKLLHANTPYAIEEQISMKEQLHIAFNKRELLLKSNSHNKSYRIKNTKVASCTMQSSPAVTKLLKVNLVHDQRQVYLYLNQSNEIEFIELDGINYMLKA